MNCYLTLRLFDGAKFGPDKILLTRTTLQSGKSEETISNQPNFRYGVSNDDGSPKDFSNQLEVRIFFFIVKFSFSERATKIWHNLSKGFNNESNVKTYVAFSKKLNFRVICKRCYLKKIVITLLIKSKCSFHCNPLD